MASLALTGISDQKMNGDSIPVFPIGLAGAATQRSVQLIFACLALNAVLGSEEVLAAYREGDRTWMELSFETKYDDNVFRMSDDEEGPVSRGDFTYTPKMTFHTETDLSRQRFFLDGSFYRTSYENNGHLNYNGMTHGVGWKWALGSKLSGSLTYKYSRALGSFEDIVQTDLEDEVRVERRSRPDIQTGKIYSFNGTYRPNRNLRLSGGYSWASKNREIAKTLDLERESRNFSVSYTFDQGTEIGYSRSYQDVDYDLESVDEFYAYNLKSEKIYIVFEVMRDVTARIYSGHQNWNYDQSGVSSSGKNEGWAVSWQATPKTSFRLAYDDSFSSPGSDVQSQGRESYNFNANWQATRKLGFSMTYSKSEQDRGGNRGDIENSIYTEDSRTVELAANWQFFRNVQLDLSYSYRERESPVERNEYESNAFSAGLNYRF